MSASNGELFEDLSVPVVGSAPLESPKASARDPHEPLPTDSEAVAAWRQRMGTEEAKTIYKERAATAECVNAIARNRGLQRFSVRGLDKARSVLLWYALAHNLMRMVELAPGLVGGLRGCEKTLAYCDRLQTPTAALRYVKSRVI